MKSASDWLRKEPLNEPLFHLNLRVRRIQFTRNSRMLKRKTTVPMTLNQSDRNGTVTLSDYILFTGDIALLECRTLAIPPVAIFNVNHVHV
jgi:hypothetical protein